MIKSPLVLADASASDGNRKSGSMLATGLEEAVAAAGGAK